MRPLKLRVLWHLIGWAYLGLVVYASLTPAPPDLLSFSMGDKVIHVTAYAIMMLWFGLLYRSRQSLLIIGALFITLGIALDLLQGRTGYRTMEVMDMVANAFGVLGGGLLARTRIGLTLIWVEDLVFDGLAERKKQ